MIADAGFPLALSPDWGERPTYDPRKKVFRGTHAYGVDTALKQGRTNDVTTPMPRLSVASSITEDA